MSKGLSQAGEGKSDNNGVPSPTGSSTFDQAMKHLEDEAKVDDAVESLDDKGKVETEGTKVSFKNEAGGRKFSP